MSLKHSIANGLRAVSKLPGLHSVLYNPSVRGVLQTKPGFSAIYGRGWDLLHPFDRACGTDSSGFVDAAELPGSPFETEKKHPYGGSQPSIIRAALSSLPALNGFTFIDLGCGRGRPLLVATEFPFRAIVGVEYSEMLAVQGARNAAIFAQRFPDRVPVRVETADASLFPFPSGDLVIFLYNPFGTEVMLKVIDALEKALAAEPRRLFVVSYNPVFGACFDASPSFSRYFAATIPYADDERGYGPDDADPVVIWQAGTNLPPHPGANARIVVTKPSMRSELQL